MTERESTKKVKRRPHRRVQILAVAVELFHERGYHATGMDDIGAAAGITGPGIYRHFRSKQDILETVIRERGETVLGEVRQIVEQAATPGEALDALVSHYAEAIVANPSLAVVALYERRTLSPETRGLIDRLERLNVEEWVHVLSLVRPELNDGEARVMVHAALGMGVAICNYRSGLDDADLTALVRSMVSSALLGDATRGPTALPAEVGGR